MSRFVLPLLFLIAASNLSPAALITVRPDGSGDYPTIQEAIDAAADGDIIELTDGTFSGWFNRDLDYQGKAITLRSQSGSADACVIDCYDEFSPHRGIVFRSAEGSGAVVQDITIVNGAAPHACGDNSGGAIWLLPRASPRILRCVFRGNAATNGGAVACDSACAAEFLDCLFEGNNAESFGGAFVSGHGSFPTVIGCTFSGNFGEGSGGAVAVLDEGASPTFLDCVFENNATDVAGGAIELMNFCEVTIARCLFRNNRSDSFAGGAVSLETGSSGSISGSTFQGNHAGMGGAFFLWDSEVRVDECTFYANGASVDSGAGFGCWPGSSIEMNHSIIAFSEAGSAIRCGSGSGAHLSCCDVYGNPNGNWIECLDGQLGMDGNIEADPLFCDAPGGVYRLRPESPCAPPVNPFCGLIGAWPAGCDPSAVDGGAPAGASDRPALEAPAVCTGTVSLRYEAAGGRSGTTEVALTVHDVTGRLRATLVRGRVPAGPRSLRWDRTDDSGRPLPQGLYFLSLRSPAGTIARRLAVLR